MKLRVTATKRLKPCKTILYILVLMLLLSSCGRTAMDSRTPQEGQTNSPINTITPIPSAPSTGPEESLKPIETPQVQETSPSPNPTPVVTPEPSQTPEPTPEPTPTPETITATPKPSSTPAPTPTPTPKPLEGIVNPYVPYTYEQMVSESKKLKEKYPDIIALDSVGLSVEGRDLTLIKLGRGEKKIMLCGAHHAREYISSSYLMKMTEEYARAYTDNTKFGSYDVKDLLDKVTIYIVPMVNPDGVNLVNNGIKAVANQEAVEAMAMVRSTYREWKANINGVDLNRQYPAHWEEKYDDVGKPASENYKGTSSASEPEVQAMMKLSREHDFILAASFHTKGNVIYWADKGTVNQIPGVKTMAKKLAQITKYQLMPISAEPSIYGAGYENWFRLEFKRPAFCIELTPYNNTDVPHDDKKFDSLVWNKAKYIGLFLAAEALQR